MKYNNSNRIIFAPLIIAFSVIAGIYIGRFYNNNSTGQPSQFFIYPRTDKLNNILNYIESEYVDTVSKERIVEKTIPKILEELDPHSVYIPAKDFVAVNESLEGNFSGIGVQFNMQRDTVIVIKTIPNGPSEKVGLLAGDRIVQVDGDTVAGVNMSSGDIVKRLKGPKGTQVNVGIWRKGVDDVIDFEITRDDIPLYSVDVAYEIEDSVGYIKISRFASTTYEEFSKAINELYQQGIEYLVIDLRGNGGGYLSEVVQIADEFLGHDELIVYTQGRSRPREERRASAKGRCLDIKTAVLIDEASASASEILAGALQDNDRAVIVGRRSFGKGLVQEQTKLADGSAIRLTTARYYTPTGRCIQRPYDNGLQDYYNELNYRYNHGEMQTADSIHFTDTLKYVTPGGKVVYGGGGIMPDYFVPVDTTGVSEYFIQVRNHGLIYRFAFMYSDNHRSVLGQFNSVNELSHYLDKQNLLARFVEFTESRDIKPSANDLSESAFLINTQLKSYIARNIYDNKGFYPLIKDIDNTLLQAIDIVKNEK